MIERVSLSHYRNIERAELCLHPRLNVFIGANAQGKTNFLEAVSFLLNRQSFRMGGGEVFTRKLELSPGSLSAEAVPTRLKAWLQPSLSLEVSWQGARKKHFINTKPWGRQKIPTQAIVFTPESLSLVQGSPQGRRDFMDELVAGYFGAQPVVADFYKCLKARNYQLKSLKNFYKQAGGGGGQPEALLSLLDVLDRQFLDLSVQISRLRQQALKLLQVPFFELCAELFATKKLDIGMDYLVSSKSAINEPESGLRALLRQKMADVALAEQQLGYALVGPQKHDLGLSVSGHDARYYCSQGQQRALVLALKIAQQRLYEQKTRPVFLLDDVFSELDAEKRLWLMGYLRRTQVQAFVSTTDCDLPQHLGQDMFVFQVARGQLSRAGD